MNDREWDKRLRIRTTGREDEANANYSPYEPTPYSVLERLADSGLIRRRDRLLDYGCGKGRVAFFMAEAVGCGVTGIDHSRKLIDIARENRRTARAGDRVTLTCCLAEQYEPASENAFFFFNPFSEKVFEGVLRRLRERWYRAPEALTLFCYYPSEEYIACLEAMPELRLVANIDCRDLFIGNNPRETIAVYAFPAR
ncbi:MAG: class I SAM-dependent methyltransferase [Clostridia bacterium]|nr:class I SAM-dependent methyltransferase [Clostridia bacterium]